MKSVYRELCLGTALAATLACCDQSITGYDTGNDLGTSDSADLGGSGGADDLSGGMMVPDGQAQPPDLVPMQPPTLRAIAPGALSNTGGALLTIAGTNFAPGATVTINGAQCTNVSVVSSTRLDCTVPAQPGVCRTVTVVVKNTDGQQARDDTKFRYLSGGPNFGAYKVYGAGTAPGRFVLADVDKDGSLDIVATNPTSSNVAVLTGTLLGTFNAAKTFSAGAGTQPSAVAVFDVDGDTLPDVVTANPGTSSVSFLKNLGGAIVSLGAPRNSASISGYGMRHLTVADVTGDGKADAVFTYGSTPAAGLLPGEGAGTFKGPPDQYLTGDSSEFVVVADVNGDNKQDMLVASAVYNGFTLWLGGAAAPFTFHMMATFTMGTGTNGLAVGDFNKDLKLDVVTSNGGSNNVSIRLGNGAGGFGNASNYMVGTAPSAVAVNDFDGDGNLDLAVANSGSGSVSVLSGKGDGTFATAADFATGAGPQSIAFADLNGDTFPDVVTNVPGLNAAAVLLGMCK